MSPPISRVFVITGPSGVGKGTLIKRLLIAVPHLKLSISATTRGPREGEVDGTDYHFLSQAEFKQRIDENDFLEWATYSGNRYGTLRSDVERCLEAGMNDYITKPVTSAQLKAQLSAAVSDETD